MSDSAVKFIVGIFPDETGAEPAMEKLKAARKDGQVELVGAVLVSKRTDGAVETQDVGLTPAKGALGGVVLGAAVGILTGGIGLAMGTIGGLIGGLMGRRRSGTQYTQDQIYHLLVSLPSGSSAILAVTPFAGAAAVERELQGLGAEVITADIPAELAARLNERGAEGQEPE